MNDHLFRHESGRMVAALTRIFGVHNLPLAEDVVQHAFLRAFEVWKLRGIPDNLSAWLMATARNRALDIVRNERTARTFAPELGRLLDSEWTMAPVVQEAFSAHTTRDEQLRMMFSCCHPALPEEAQVALMLNILCGFGADEIAGAFLVKRAAMEKRITRGKKTLATSKRLFDLKDEEFAPRLDAVRRGLYLLFNEGYHGSSARVAVRGELCHEAMRLVGMLMDHADGATFSTYHIEAAIAAAHSQARSLSDTNWTMIVLMYDRLMSIAPSPVVSLNRAVAVGERDGAAAGLQAIRGMADRDRLVAYPFYFAAMGELEVRIGNVAAALGHFEDALRVARNATERRFLSRKLERLR